MVTPPGVRLSNEGAFLLNRIQELEQKLMEQENKRVKGWGDYQFLQESQIKRQDYLDTKLEALEKFNDLHIQSESKIHDDQKEQFAELRDMYKTYTLNVVQMDKELTELKVHQDNLWEVKENQIKQIRKVLRDHFEFHRLHGSKDSTIYREMQSAIEKLDGKDAGSARQTVKHECKYWEKGHLKMNCRECTTPNQNYCIYRFKEKAQREDITTWKAAKAEALQPDLEYIKECAICDNHHIEKEGYTKVYTCVNCANILLSPHRGLKLVEREDLEEQIHNMVWLLQELYETHFNHIQYNQIDYSRTEFKEKYLADSKELTLDEIADIQIEKAKRLRGEKRK